MQNNSPLVSIGMPVFNGEHYLRHTLNSLLGQDYDNFELIISDNASTDNTGEICHEYLTKDKRIRYVRNSRNIGGLLNAKRVFELSQGPFFMWAACHDLLEPSFISQAINVMEKEPNVVLCYFQADWIDDSGASVGMVNGGIDTRAIDRLSRCHLVLWGFKNGAPIYGMMRSSVLKQIRLGVKTLGPDMLCLFSLSLLGEFAFIPQTLFHFRVSDTTSAEIYIEKSYGNKLKKYQKRWLFWRTIFEYLFAITRHYKCRSAWPGLMISVVYGVSKKYSNVRQSMLAK